MRTLNELVFASLVAVGAILVPQAAAVVLLALIYIRLDPRPRS
jgi:hypothetical protein